PQLWNVARGQMSLVGPRPITPEDGADLDDWQLQRHQVRPGVTGLWHVEARGDGRELPENLHYDIQYIDQLSVLTDLRILGMTVTAIASRREGKPLPGTRRTRIRDRVPHFRLIVTDLSLWLIAIPLAVYVRYDFGFGTSGAGRIFATAGAAIALQAVWGRAVGSYRGRWRVGSFEETLWVAAGAASITLALLVVATFITPLIARGALVGAGAFHLLGAMFMRYIA
ncbi:MAG: hypothetical protein GY953_52135, partial [bacterium]|nr:hypothetical protein [bacterium]